MFCPECSIDHHIADREEEKAADRQIQLAKIEADRDIKIAQITAGAARDLAETDNALSTARAKGQAEGMETVLGELGGGGQAPDAEPELELPAPEPEPAPDPPADLEPPIVETSRPSSSSSGSSDGWWAGYPRG